MRHAEVIQRLLALCEAPDYLEIGVCDGATFHAVQAARKVAVDPDFRFDLAAARADPANVAATYHALPSDAYFAGPGREARFDVIFLDGLHTFDQTLRDLLNAIDRLKPGGLILIDDVRPTSYAAALPSMDDWLKMRRMGAEEGRGWMGDVYRLVFFIRDYLPTFSYATIEEGLERTLLWRAPRSAPVDPLSMEAIARLDYRDAVFRTRAFNLRPFAEIEAEVRAWREFTAAAA